MPKVIIRESVLVVRSGKRVHPDIGKVFDLTADEISQLKDARPSDAASRSSAFDSLEELKEDPNSVDTDEDGGKPAAKGAGKKGAGKADDL